MITFTTICASVINFLVYCPLVTKLYLLPYMLCSCDFAQCRCDIDFRRIPQNSCLFWKQLSQMVVQTWLSLVRLTCGSAWPIFHGPVILPYILKTIWCMYIILWDYESYDLRFDLKINVGHCDMYFMGQWFFLVSWRLFDVWTSLFEIMNTYDPTFDLKIIVGHCDLYFMVQWFRG